jgi:hypothetical protein
MRVVIAPELLIDVLQWLRVFEVLQRTREKIE